ncbi:uncharacterized protein J3D65DRAFT_620830 [Phyllosticta citribraziliensis]|uniref:Uncharacterized protein n=1 Tax=Phyllosticta citribraziliensis TaxID=989973 RepID=A0ABR1L6Z9_9PEZI
MNDVAAEPSSSSSASPSPPNSPLASSSSSPSPSPLASPLAASSSSPPHLRPRPAPPSCRPLSSPTPVPSSPPTSPISWLDLEGQECLSATTKSAPKTPRKQQACRAPSLPPPVCKKRPLLLEVKADEAELRAWLLAPSTPTPIRKKRPLLENEASAPLMPTPIHRKCPLLEVGADELEPQTSRNVRRRLFRHTNTNTNNIDAGTGGGTSPAPLLLGVGR